MCEYVVKIEWHMHILSPVIKFNNADKFGKNMLGHWHKAVIKFADSQRDWDGMGWDGMGWSPCRVSIDNVGQMQQGDDDVNDAARKVLQVQWQQAMMEQGGKEGRKNGWKNAEQIQKICLLNGKTSWLKKTTISQGI